MFQNGRVWARCSVSSINGAYSNFKRIKHYTIEDDEYCYYYWRRWILLLLHLESHPQGWATTLFVWYINNLTDFQLSLTNIPSWRLSTSCQVD